MNEVKKVIKDTINQYKEDKNVDDSLLWEMIKMNIRKSSVKYGARKKKTYNSEKFEPRLVNVVV